MVVTDIALDIEAVAAMVEIMEVSELHFEQQTVTKVALHLKFMIPTILQLLIDFLSITFFPCFCVHCATTGYGSSYGGE